MGNVINSNRCMLTRTGALGVNVGRMISEVSEDRWRVIAVINHGERTGVNLEEGKTGGRGWRPRHGMQRQVKEGARQQALRTSSVESQKGVIAAQRCSVEN